MAKRDNFTKEVKDQAAKRVAYRCSFPGCGIATVGPQYGNPLGVASIGVACHICAASPGGPRYDESMDKTQRKSIENCIWMCENHSVMIDRDEEKYPVELLKAWKVEAENKAAENLGDYELSKAQLKDTSSLKLLFDDLIKDGNYDVLRMLIDKTKTSNKNSELPLRYEIIYNIYCNREALLLSINYYLENTDVKQCDEILKILIANNISTGIELLLPFCYDEEMKTLADKIKEGTIKEYIFRSKEDVEKGIEDVPVFKDADTIQKLLSNVVVDERFPALPCMADGKKFELFEKEFAFEMLAHSWRLFNSIVQQTSFNKRQGANDSYALIKNAIPKIIKLDRELQLVIWLAILDYAINDVEEFNSIYSLCPVLIKEEPKCKRLELIFRLMHDQVNIDELLENDEIKGDQESLIHVLRALPKEKRFDFLEDHKYLLKKNSIFIYLWVISCGLAESAISGAIGSYQEQYKEDFLWNCLAAYYETMGNPPINLTWIIQNKQGLSYPTVDLYIRLLSKYAQWNELKSLVEIAVSPYVKYQIALALMSNTSIEHLQFCIDVFKKLEEDAFYEEWFYHNFSVLYYHIGDIEKAKFYLEKEFDASSQESSLLTLLKLRYESSDFKTDKYIDYASRSNNSELLFLVAIFFEKKQDYPSQKVYLLKALLSSPESKNALREMAVWYLHHDQDDDGEIGKIYTIKNESHTIKLALIDSNIITGITPKEIIGCTPVNASSAEFNSWSFCSIDDIVKYQDKDYTIVSIDSFSKALSQYVIGRLMTADGVTTIRGDSTEEAVGKIQQILSRQEEESKRIFAEFNKGRGIFPVSLLARQLGCGYNDAWSTIITSNELKINNHSTDIPQDYKFILTQDAIFTIALLNGFDDLNGETFILPQQVKTAVLSKLTDKLCQLQEKHSVGSIYSRENQLYGVEYDNKYKRGASLFWSGIKAFIEKTPSVSCEVYQSSIPEFKSFFAENNLPHESYTFGLAKTDDKFVLVTDEPFICIICDMEKIPHVSAIDLLLMQNISHEKLLGYLERLSECNFLNFFNAKIYKKMIDLALREDEEKANAFFERLYKWLIPETSSRVHKERVFNVYRELGMESMETNYFHSLSEIGRFYFAELFPEKHQELMEQIRNMQFRVKLVPTEEEEVAIQIEEKNDGDDL